MPCTSERGSTRAMLAARALAGHPPDPRADGLDRRHQRKGEHHRPQHVDAELRARLCIGGDAARIIIRRAGDEARARTPKPGDFRRLGFGHSTASIRMRASIRWTCKPMRPEVGMSMPEYGMPMVPTKAQDMRKVFAQIG